MRSWPDLLLVTVLVLASHWQGRVSPSCPHSVSATPTPPGPPSVLSSFLSPNQHTAVACTWQHKQHFLNNSDPLITFFLFMFHHSHLSISSLLLSSSALSLDSPSCREIISLSLTTISLETWVIYLSQPVRVVSTSCWSLGKHTCTHTNTERKKQGSLVSANMIMFAFLCAFLILSVSVLPHDCLFFLLHGLLLVFL